MRRLRLARRIKLRLDNWEKRARRRGSDEARGWGERERLQVEAFLWSRRGFFAVVRLHDAFLWSTYNPRLFAIAGRFNPRANERAVRGMGTINRMISICGLLPSPQPSLVLPHPFSLSDLLSSIMRVRTRWCALASYYVASDIRVSSRNYASFFEVINKLVYCKGLISERDSLGAKPQLKLTRRFFSFEMTF